jgi:zinc/manganese transport system substrate-binding protein
VCLRLCLATVLVAVVAAGCGSAGGAGGHGLSVVATTMQAGDLVRNVGGARVAVHTLLRPSADPHDYEPRPSDAKAVSEARMVFRAGGDVDGWMRGLLGQAGGKATVVTLIDFVPRIRFQGQTDPHWWQNPRNAELAVGAIERALIRADPKGRRAYERNVAAYSRRLRELDAGFARCIALVPVSKRRIVTTHESLRYLARRYGLEVVGSVLPSLSTLAQPSAREIEQLVGRIRRERVSAIFPESAVNPKLEKAVARESGARVAQPLWVDSLGKPGSGADTYLRATASNAGRLVRGMTGGRRSCRLRTP